MTEIKSTRRSLRAARLQATVPRALAALVALILCAAGVRSIVARQTTTVVTHSPASTVDQGAESFAEAFARSYLTWSSQSQSQSQRETALQPYLSNALDQNGGFQTGNASTESVSWTSVAGGQAIGGQTLVTVAAQTTDGMVYLSVPVGRDSHGFLFVSGYPAIVGPPASDPNASLPAQQQVTDSSLQTVVARAVTNYLAGNKANLLADLTPTALVSLPTRHMSVTTVQQATWVTPGSRVAIQVVANDSHGDSFTLSYELGVEKLDRWYVQSIQVDPTFKGGTS